MHPLCFSALASPRRHMGSRHRGVSRGIVVHTQCVKLVVYVERARGVLALCQCASFVRLLFPNTCS